MSSHPWFLGRDGPEFKALPEFMTFPRSSKNSECSTEELETIGYLNRWGISRKSLVQSSDMGARSSLVATYRIMLHRLLQRKDLDEDYAALAAPFKLELETHSSLSTPEPVLQKRNKYFLLFFIINFFFQQ